MRKIFSFMMVSLDGFFEGPEHDLSWHNVDAEFIDYAIEQTKKVGLMLYGRRTYQLMESFWPTEQAKDDPKTAELMNNTPKIVFSKTLSEVHETKKWKNVKLLHEVDPDYVKKLKEEAGGDIAVYGSDNLCLTLIEHNLIDEFKIMVNPVVLGAGTRLFEGIKNKLELKLLDVRGFKNGNALLTYVPKSGIIA